MRRLEFNLLRDPACLDNICDWRTVISTIGSSNCQVGRKMSAIQCGNTEPEAVYKSASVAQTCSQWPAISIFSDKSVHAGNAHGGKEPAKKNLGPTVPAKKCREANPEGNAAWPMPNEFYKVLRAWIRLPSINLSELDEGESVFKRVHRGMKMFIMRRQRLMILFKRRVGRRASRDHRTGAVADRVEDQS